MNLNRRKIGIAGKTVELNGNPLIEDLERIIAEAKAEGHTEYYVSAIYERCGNSVEGYEIDFATYREENDEEYNARIEKERKEEENERVYNVIAAERVRANKLKEFNRLKEELGL